MAKTRSGKKMNNLCKNVPSKTKKKTKTYSATDEVTNDKIKIIGIRKSDRNMAKSSAAEMMKNTGKLENYSRNLNIMNTKKKKGLGVKIIEK